MTIECGAVPRLKLLEGMWGLDNIQLTMLNVF